MAAIMNGAPRVTVLMPVYNGEAYLREAVASILGQSFTDFELLVINDGSCDRSVDVLTSFDDHRIRLVHNTQNLGLIASLNRGFELSQGEYIARMDCDDISLPERLEKQVAFLDAHPNAGVCGTWFRKFGQGVHKVVRWESAPDSVRSAMLFSCSLAHPTIMLRRCVFDSYGLRYDPEYLHAEDYDLWVRALKYMDMANLPEVLLDYRVHPDQVTQRLSKTQIETAGRVRKRQLEEAGFVPTPEDFLTHQAISICESAGMEHPFQAADDWLVSLVRRNSELRVYPKAAFSQVLLEKWLTFVNKCRKTPYSAARYLLRRPRFMREAGLGWVRLLKTLFRLRG